MERLDDAVTRAVGSKPVGYAARPGGYSTAQRYAVELADGRSVFVKSSDVPLLAGWIRREHEVYEALAAPFMPELVGFDDDGECATLVLEDLSGADWSVRWDEARIDAVLETLASLAGSTPPAGTPSVREQFAQLWGRWQIVADDPAPFLSLGLRDAKWLERSLPQILAAAESAPIEGETLGHYDVRSDNMCFRDGRAILVDWNWCCLTNPQADIASWLPSVRIEGGPPPWEVLPSVGEIAAWVAGIWAAVAGQPPVPTAPNVREFQRRALAVALDWIDRDLL
jgi:thiamine kinase-like enzyme